MPSRKQRRRRAKEHRHEYVWEDAEGNELEPDEVPTRKASADRSPRPAASPRQAQPPSWGKTLKRGAIFAPIMFVTVMLLSSDLTLASQILQTAIIVAIFIPFSYMLDTVFWRSYQRRLERRQQGAPGRRES
jgi:ferric-dicitrate binding protein FerR (iron transport regulator)